MKRGFIWMVLTCLMVISMVLASCNKTTSVTTSTSTTASTSTTTTTKTTTTTTSTSSTTTSTTTAGTGHWWDQFGTPEYGGQLVLRTNMDIAVWDPYYAAQYFAMFAAYMEAPTAIDWTLDPKIFGNNTNWIPTEYVKGLLMESWEFSDPSTYVMHLRKGIHWQNIPPANGREFTADDVKWDYDRMYGKGSGFTKPSPYVTTVSQFAGLQSITVIDKYTVSFQWNTTSAETILEGMQSASGPNCIVNPEAVKLWGDVNDWHHAIGTGPFIVNDYVSGGSCTMVKNPNYWGYDERHPQNQLPYVDSIKFLVIPDNATAMAGLRTGKIDDMEMLSIQNAQAIQKTNPEILIASLPANQGGTVDMRHDVKPFSDIRFRQALQQSIDLPTIASTYFLNYAPPYPINLTTQFMTGWGFPYSDWPQDLKDEYAYNPTKAKQLLADAGYPNGFKVNVVADATSDLDLLQIVKSYFAAIGVDMTIQTMDSPSWVSFVQQGHKYDGLAFRAGGSIGTSAGPLRQLSYFVTGMSTNWQLISDPNLDANYKNALAATSQDQIKQMLKSSNEIMARQHYMVCLLQPSTFTLYQPWVKAYTGQFSAFYGTPYGPTYPGFYASRVWIDQKLKKSMGH